MRKSESAVVKIGNAQGFWGDSPLAPLTLVHQQPDLDYLTLDYLSELSMSILAIQKEKDPSAGYAADFIDVITSLIPEWKKGSRLKIVTNGGGLNPLACALACRKVLNDASLSHLVVAAIEGDNVLSAIQERDEQVCSFRHLETEASIASIAEKLVTANAYLGARPLVEALQQGADIVITGRVADPSLTVAPAIFFHGWDFESYDLLAQATIAGHLIECGTQVTGGASTHWLSIPAQAALGFPLVEVASDGSFVITKPQNSGGRVDVQTVKEQLLYEIGDPANYLSPDVSVSFLSIELESDGKDRIKITGAKGKPPPPFYKVSATYRAGYKAEAMLALFGPEATKKAKLCGDVILHKVALAGFSLERSIVECLGAGDVVGGTCRAVADEGHFCLMECVLRIAVADHRKQAVEAFSKEIAPLITSGPQGITGYASGRPRVRQLFGYWPCLIPCNQVQAHVEILRE